MKFLKLVPIYAVVLANALTSTKANEAHSFDWDDNVMTMTTKIVLRNKITGEQRLITTREYADIRAKLGTEGEYQNFVREIVETDPNRNYFLEAMIQAIETLPAEEWQGPFWNRFVYAMSEEATAENTSIITARMASRKHIAEAIFWLQKNGYIRFAPSSRNIFPVGNKDLFPGDRDVAELKFLVMQNVLDELESEPASHSWNFSDDDKINIEFASTRLKEEIALGRWPNISISVTHTVKITEQKLSCLQAAIQTF